MTKKLTAVIVLALVMVIVPIGGIYVENNAPQKLKDIARPDKFNESINLATPTSAIDYTSKLKVYDVADQKVHTITAMEYVAGAVALEMPVTFDPQALAAQAIAAHTYARYCQLFNQEYKNSDLKGADLMVDTKNNVGYLPKDKVKLMYGDRFDESWALITSAAEIGVNHVLEYQNSPILASYYAISAGNTEASENVWNSGFDYLVPVSSPGDTTVKGYKTSVEFNISELKALLIKAFPDAKLSADYKKWIMPISYSTSGYITEVQVGDIKTHGKNLRTALNLRSTNFTIEYKDSSIIFTTIGYGHGVGLSQTGANFMAQEGSVYSEILEHYYPGSTLLKVKK